MIFRIESGLPLPPRRPDKPDACTFCGNKAGTYSKRLCHKCYERNRRKGSPEYTVQPGLSLEVKIQRLSRPDGECVAWEGKCNDGTPIIGGRNVRRLVYEKRHGIQPQFARFRSTCGNGRCICLGHIEANSSLPEQEVAQIIVETCGMPKRDAARAMSAAGLNKRQIGDALGVTRERARQLVDMPGPAQRKKMEVRAAKIVELLGKGRTPGEIGRELGLTYGMVSLTIRNYITPNGGCDMEYLKQLKARRDELQAKVDELASVMEELRRVKSAINVLEPRQRSGSPKSEGNAA